MAQGGDRLREITPKAFGKGDSFWRKRRAKGENSRLRLFDRKQVAHSARQSPERPPLFSSRRMPSSTIARSSAFAMSSRVSSATRSEEHTSELQSLMRISYAVFCLKKKKT